MRRIITHAVVLLLFQYPVFSQAAQVTLPEILTHVLTKSPDLSRIQLDYEAKLSDSKGIKTWSNPQLQLDTLNARNGDTNVSVELTQPIRWSQLNGIRMLYAQTLSDSASTTRQFETFNLINDISLEYMKLWLLQSRRQLYTRFAADAKRITTTVQFSAKHGQVPQSSVGLFAADAERLAADILTIDAEILQLKADLAKRSGFSFEKIEAVKPVTGNIPDTGKLIAFAGKRVNLRAVIHDRLAAAKKRMSVAEADAFPDFGARVLLDRSLSGNTDNAVGVGLSLNIPLWDRNQAERQRARAELIAIQQEADSLTIQKPALRIRELRQRAQSLLLRSKRYADSIMPQFRKSYRLNCQMWQAGQIQSLDLWQIRDRVYRIEEENLAAIWEAYQARLTLEQELGGKLEEVQ